MLNNNSDTISGQQYDEVGFSIGLSLAVLSTIFIGSSFIIKKKALIRINNRGSLRAGAGGFGYLKEWMWWAGFLSMGIGEVANFTAYAFAPASLVTPLGALSVLVSAVLASKFLHERLNLLGKLGCVLCILGSTVIVIHSPKEEEVESMEVLFEKLQDSAFITYVILVIITFLSIFFYFGPRYGHHNVTVYILLCSAVGSLTVMACKGLGIAIKETVSGKVNEAENWLTWMFLVSVVVCIMVQMNYLNKALDLFNTGIVTPVYYVLFTTLVIVASAILFREWENMNAYDVIGNLCGFSTVVIAIVMLNGFKDVDISLSDVHTCLRTKQKEDAEYRSNGKKSYRSDEESLVGESSSHSNYGIRNSYTT